MKGLVGRVGFEPTFPRLKGGCLEPLGYRPVSLTNCGGGIRTHGGRFNRAVPYQLGYATPGEVAGAGIEPAFGGRLMRPPCPPGHIPAQGLRRRDSNPHTLVY